jgi:lysophospholipase L1-like esterase
MFGDSLMNEGHYSDDFPQYVAPDPQGSVNKDFGISPRLEGLRADLGRTATIRSVAVGGARCTGTALNGLYDQIENNGPADLLGADVYIQIGTNDVLGGAGVMAGYEAALQSNVDSLIAKNAGKIFISTVPSTQNQAGADPAEVALVAQANASIASVITATPNAYISDLFTATGGESYDTQYFQASNLHLSPAGNVLAADMLNSAIVASESTTAPTLTTPYVDLINLNTDVVAGVDLNTNISGETSLVVTWDPAIPSGLSETAGVVSGTVTTPTGTSICTVTGTNSFGSISDKFQWTTLTTGAASNINTTIND